MKLPSLRRTIDIAVGSIGLIVFAVPIAAMIALSRLESGKSGLFRQIRYGLKGKPFEILKIRNLDDNGNPLPISGAIRKTGLDELPQLVNLIKGDMSLIGPRPSDRLFNIQGWDHILEIQPGVTGLSAVSEKEVGVQNSLERRLNLEKDYVDRRLSDQSVFAADMQILLRTMKVILACKADAGKHERSVLSKLQA